MKCGPSRLRVGLFLGHQNKNGPTNANALTNYLKPPSERTIMTKINVALFLTYAIAALVLVLDLFVWRV